MIELSKSVICPPAVANAVSAVYVLIAGGTVASFVADRRRRER